MYCTPVKIYSYRGRKKKRITQAELRQESGRKALKSEFKSIENAGPLMAR